MKQSGWLCLAVVLFLSGLLSACAGTVPTRLQVGGLYGADLLPLAIMQQEGLDRLHGFRLELEVCSSAHSLDAQVAAGNVDVVLTDVIRLCAYRGQKIDLQIGGCIAGDHLLYAAPATGVTRLSGAKGCRAGSAGRLDDFLLDQLLLKQGLPTDFVPHVPIPSPLDLREQLQTGQVVLALLPEPLATLAQQERAVLLGSANTNGIFPRVWAYTSASFIHKREALSGFLAAYNQAVDFLNTRSYTELAQLAIEYAGYPASLARAVRLPTYRHSLSPTPEWWEQAANWSVAHGLCLPKDVSPPAMWWFAESTNPFL